MTSIVGILGRKGGSGKSLLAHLLAHGVMYMGGFSVMMMTDVRTARPPEWVDARKYMLASVPQGRDIKDIMVPILTYMEAVPNSVMVVDGGANRRNIDFVVSELCDMILIPTGSGAEEMQVAEADYFELAAYFEAKGMKKDIFIVLNKWPGEARKRHALESKPRIREMIHRWDRMGILLPEVFPYIQSFSDMADGQDPKYTPLIDGKARDFARLITNRLGLDIERDKAEEEARKALAENQDENSASGTEPVQTAETNEPARSEANPSEEQLVSVDKSEQVRRQLVEQVHEARPDPAPTHHYPELIRKTA